jgi:hypothetical protein
MFVCLLVQNLPYVIQNMCHYTKRACTILREQPDFNQDLANLPNLQVACFVCFKFTGMQHSFFLFFFFSHLDRDFLKIWWVFLIS